MQSRLTICGLRNYSTSKNHYDIIVAGGGMIGTTLACTLSKNPKLQNKSILLLEGAKKKTLKIGEKYSNRVSSLNPGTITLLDSIGVWNRIKSKRYGVIKRMQVWDALSDALITFDHPQNDIAYVVENDLLIDSVEKELETDKKIEIIHEAKIKQFQKNGTEKLELVLENGKEYSCELLLGCDGANSQVRRSADLQYLTWNYERMGVVATLRLNSGTDFVDNLAAWQRFMPDGPIALLPLNQHYSSLVWSTTPGHAKKLLQLPVNEFVEAVNEAFIKNYKKSSIIETSTRILDNFLRFSNLSTSRNRQIPPKIVDCVDGSRAAFPLGFGHSTNYIGQNVVLVGDAAHRVHPLAGQGVNLGFGDVRCLNEVLGAAVYDGSRLNNLIYLKRYETERQRHNVPTMLAIDGLHKLYSINFLPIVLLRSLGLQITHSLNPLKKMIINHASV